MARPKEKELEYRVGSMGISLRKLSAKQAQLMICPGVTVEDVRKLLVDVHKFIDFTKFEFGEDITG